ncbi:MAG: PAS domain S-box protein [Vicinamibacteria bacterium]
MKKNRTGRAASPAADHATDTRDEPRAGGSFPIVGVGASAGGLEAFSAFLTHLPLDTGMGFVLVQHLDPEHDSALSQLLGRATSLPVHEVTNNLRVEPNHVYVIPPNTNLSIAGGVLTLRRREETRTPHRSIDFFLEALAEDQRERAVGVVLSGTATDGTLGLEAIKAEGGITFAQDDSARYDSMPRSAVAAGCVDFVLSPENIAKELARIAKHPYVAGAAPESPSRAEDDRASATAHEDDDTPLPSGGRGAPRTGSTSARAEAKRRPVRKVAVSGAEEGFKKIMLLLRNHSGVDFSLYKSNTIQRRITRRMVLNKYDTLDQYARFLRGNTKELDALYSDTLISVTSFFRNPDAFDVLQRQVWPALLRQSGDDPLRVWVLGCSTGQEAYSIAMAFVEAAERAPRMRMLQVFATDLNEALLDKARHGLYAKSLAQDVSPERLRRFFVEEEGGYRVGKALREMVVFARQNVISDPPFSRMDLISCRNLLIYLEPGLQKKVFPIFHYALKPGGFLFLGASESIGRFTELFEPMDKKHKIYVKKGAHSPPFQLPVRKERGEPPASDSRKARPSRQMGPEPGGTAEGLRSELNAQREADRVAVNQFAPPAVLINAELQILQFRGPTGAYLEPPPGKATFEVLKMARAGLMLPLRAAINKAKKDNKTARKEDVRVEQDGKIRTVNVEVIPLKNLPERCFLIVFEDAEKAARGGPLGRLAHAVRSPRREALRRIADLETELAETRDYLQSVQEQHEAANEELQASNEEVQSANEELQSTNEELETSKEELESANEELTTVNEEMANRNAELNRLNSDLVNVQTSAHLAMVLVGRNLAIRRFSVQAEKQFNLMAADVGRPIGHVRHNLHLPDLEAFITDVIDTVRSCERDVQDKDGRWFSLRVLPYLTLDNKVDGAVLVLVDIDALKRSEQATAAAREYAESIIETVREPLVVLDRDLRVDSANRSFYATFGATPAGTIGELVYDLGNRQWDIPELRALLEEILARNHVIEDFSVEYNFGQPGRRTMLLNARRMHNPERKVERVLLAIEDVTERQRAEESRSRLAAIVESTDDAIVSKDLNGVITSWNTGAERLFGYTAQEAVGQPVTLLIPQERLYEETVILERIRRAEVVEPYETVRRRKDGTLIDASVTVSPIRDHQGKIVGASKIARDVSERRKAAEALRQSEATFRALAEASAGLIWHLDPRGRSTYVNPQYLEYFGKTADEVLGDAWHPLLHPEDAPAYLALVAASQRNRERLEAAVRVRDKHGAWRWLESHALPLFGSNNEYLGHVGFSLDITERKQHEEMLFEADRHKNEFLAMLAHELRNPLAPILNSLEIMRRANRGVESSSAPSTVTPSHEPETGRLAPSHPLDSAVDVLERQVGQMVRLVDDLLDAGRISRGRIELRREHVELSSVVRQALEAVRPLSESLSQELTIALPPAPVYVNADPTRLAQIVGNLLNNACKFTDRGGRIWLTVERGEEPGADDTPQVDIRVRDAGIGIAADQLPRVFDMFTQIDTSLDRSVTGLGIGLTLVKTLAEMHGGSVEVSSAGIGQGTEVVVRLPIAVEAPTPAPPATTREPAVATALRILVVDDNRDAAESLATLLQLGGHETHMAHDGLEAVEAATILQPDVILLDIGLPGLNGYEAARRIRERQENKRPVLVALTGRGQEEDRHRSNDAGFDAHMVKPVDNVALMEQLLRLGVGD